MRKRPATFGIQAVGLILALSLAPLDLACLAHGQASHSPQQAHQENQTKKPYAIEVERAIAAITDRANRRSSVAVQSQRFEKRRYSYGSG